MANSPAGTRLSAPRPSTNLPHCRLVLLLAPLQADCLLPGPAGSVGQQLVHLSRGRGELGLGGGLKAVLLWGMEGGDAESLGGSAQDAVWCGPTWAALAYSCRLM